MANSFTDQLKQTVKDQITNPESLARRALQQAVAAGVPITQLPQKFKEYGYDPQTGRILPQSPIYAENRDMSDPNNQLAVGMMIGAAEPTGGNAAILKAQLNRKMDPGYDLKPPASMSQAKFRPIDEVAPEPDIKKIQLDTTTPKGTGKTVDVWHGHRMEKDFNKYVVPTDKITPDSQNTAGAYFFSENKANSESYANRADFGNDALKQYTIKTEKPLDLIDEGDHTIGEWKQVLKKYGVDTSKIKFDSSLTDPEAATRTYGYRKDGKHLLGFQELIGQNDYWRGNGNLIDQLKKQGFDAFRTAEGGGTWGVFDRKNIMSKPEQAVRSGKVK